jgi:hypothetical protein
VPHHLDEAWVRAEVIESGLLTKVNDVVTAVFYCLIQPVESRILVIQSRSDSHHVNRWHVFLFRQADELGQQLLSFSRSTRDGVGVAERHHHDRAAAGEFACFLKLVDGFCDHAFLFVSAPLKVMRQQEMRIKLESPSALLEGFVITLGIQVKLCGGGVGDGRQRVKSLGQSDLSDGSFRPASRDQIKGIPFVARRIVGVQLQGSLKFFLGIQPVPIMPGSSIPLLPPSTAS